MKNAGENILCTFCNGNTAAAAAAADYWQKDADDGSLFGLCSLVLTVTFGKSIFPDVVCLSELPRTIMWRKRNM